MIQVRNTGIYVMSFKNSVKITYPVMVLDWKVITPQNTEFCMVL